MPTLTIEHLRENPWSVISHRLPEHPESLLLELAHLAADYCRKSEYRLRAAARHGRYVPIGQEDGDDCCDVHEESETCGDEADQKFREICGLHIREFGVLIDE